MRATTVRFTRLLFAAAMLLVAGSASAQATRTWVSGTGDDVNPCSRTAQCKTIAGAISKTASGGVINMLDSGGYGCVTITKPITIDGAGVMGGVLGGGNCITVNLPTPGVGDVVLRGLAVHGVTAAVTGIRILSAGNVLIEDVQVRNFPTAGIDIVATADLRVTVRNSSFNNLGGPAIRASSTGGTAVVEVDTAVATRATHGIMAGANSRIRAKNMQVNDATVAAYAAAQGAGTSAEISLESSSATDSPVGVSADGAATRVTLSGTTVSGNVEGLVTTAGGTIASFGDNRVIDNGVNGTPTEELGHQ